MSDLHVVEWISCKEADERGLSDMGGMGGWVQGENWNEYLSQFDSKNHTHLEALRKAVLAEGLRIGGDDHQAAYVPVFSDGTCAIFSFRAWGDLLAAIYNTHENTSEYGYMDFYMSCLIKNDEF